MKNKYTDNTNNLSYIFIPYEIEGDFDTYVKNIKKTWEEVNEDINYLFRYVVRYLRDCEESNRRYYHFILNNIPSNNITIVGEKPDKDPKDYKARLLGIEAFVFGTKMVIFAVPVELLFDDKDMLTRVLIQLKKMDRCHIKSEGDEKSSDELEYIGGIIRGTGVEFDESRAFSFANRGHTRANIMTYFKSKNFMEIERDTHHITHGYNKTSQYEDYSEIELMDNGEYIRSEFDRAWKVTKEQLAVCYDGEKSDDFPAKFYTNFNTSYLFMYVLLLHQKYMYYMLMMDLIDKDTEKIEVLEEYQSRLYDFEMNYCYKVASEVEQYQMLYDSVRRVFQLDELHDGLYEPLSNLGKLRRRQDEDRTELLNNSVFVISFLAIISALLDGNELVDALVQSVQNRAFDVTTIFKAISFVGIIVIAGFCMVRCIKVLFNSGKDKR